MSQYPTHPMQRLRETPSVLHAGDEAFYKLVIEGPTFLTVLAVAEDRRLPAAWRKMLFQGYAKASGGTSCVVLDLAAAERCATDRPPQNATTEDER